MATNNSSNMNIVLSALGTITEPLQPAFMAQCDADTINATGDGTVFQCTFTEVFDKNGNFAANTFTAPVTGEYLFHTQITIAAAGAAHTTGKVSIVTTANTFDTYFNPFTALGGATKVTITCNTLCSMTAGDTAIVNLTITGGTKTVTYCGAAAAYTYFSGALIC